MKAEMKAVVASLVVIALALTAVSGVTYSWFSAEERADIDVSTAKIDISGAFSDEAVYPVGTTTVTSTGDNLKINDLVDGKTVTAKYTVTNNSSVETKYRMYVQLVGDLDPSKFVMSIYSGSEPTALTFNSGIAYADGGNTGRDLDKGPMTIQYNVTIKFHLDTSDMGKSFSFNIVTEAYQSDYTYSDVAILSPAGESTIPSGASGKDVKIVGTAPKATGSSATPAPISVELSSGVTSKVTSSGTTDVTLKAEMVDAPAGVTGTALSIGFTGSSVTDFGTDKVTVTVTVPGSVSDDFTVVYLGVDKGQPTDITKKDVGSGMVEITFTTTHFSDFLVSKDVVAIEDTDSGVGVYKSLSEAIANAKDGGRVTLVKDVTIDSTISTDKNFTLDLNGKNITGNNARVIQVCSGEVTIEGKGTIERVDDKIINSSVIRVGSDGATGTTGDRPTATLTIGTDVLVKTETCYGVGAFGENQKCTLVLNGTVETKVYSAVAGNGQAKYAGTEITIGASAVIKSADCPAIYHPQAGTLTVYGIVDGGIEAKAGEIHLESGATIKSNGSTSHEPNYDGTSTNGYAVAIVLNDAYKGPAEDFISNGATIEGTVAFLDDTVAGTEMVAQISDDYVFATLALAMKYAPAKSEVIVLKDIVVSSTISVHSNIILNLNGKSIKASFGDILIMVYKDGDLTINGDGSVEGGENGNAQAIQVYGKLTVNGGDYTVGKDADGNGNSVIECRGGSIVINGGSFYTDYSWNGFYYVLNQVNNNPGTITVFGGSFTNYDPSKGDDNLHGNFVADGYKVTSETVGEKTIYTVIKVTE